MLEIEMLREKIKQYQLISFFVFAYLGTWLLLLPFLLTGNEQAFGILVMVGIFCPAFLNIIISRIINPITDDIDPNKRRITFLVAWIIATVIFTLNVKTTSGIESPVAIVFYAILGILPALVLASVFSKYSSVRESLSSLLKPKGWVGWYLFALLIIPLIRIISVPITRLLGLEAIDEPDNSGNISQLIGLIAVTFFYGLVFTGGLNEETGWTGFALPRLQARFSPLISSIVLWFFWILWHMPMQIAGYWNSDIDSFIRALIGTFFARFIFTWLYNKTKAGILPAILFHASANTCFAFLPVNHVHMVLEAILAIIIIIGSRMWVKLSEDHPAVYGETVKDG
jgi:membrane protease YdiL (CAAX protease family)